MPEFDRIVHPDYKRMALRWRMAQAFARGGIHVLEPDYAATPAFTATAIQNAASVGDAAGGTPPDLGKDDTEWKWTASAYKSFLWKHRRETDSEFDERSERQIHIPLFMSLINIFAAGILRKDVRYEGGDPDQEPWKAYVDDVDMCDTGMPAFRRESLQGAETFGRFHAITDRPRFEDRATNLQQQQQRGERTFSYLVSPLDIPDWETDGRGKFQWVRIAEPFVTQRTPDQDPSVKQIQYRIWFQDHWELYQPADGQGSKESTNYTLVAEDPHPVGRVPLRTMNLARESQSYNMACESPLSDALGADRYILNAMSELDEMERAQAFAILFVPGQKKGGIDINPFRAIGGEDATMAPQYIAPPAELADSKWKRIEAKLWAMKQYFGAGRGLAEFSSEERSGVALNIETEDKRNQMQLWSSAMQEFENGLYEDSAAWNGTPDDHPVVVYPDSFDIKSIAAQVQEMVSLASADAGMVPRQVSVRMATPIVERIMREGGAGSEEIKDVLDLMKKHAEKPDDAVTAQMPTQATMVETPDGQVEGA